MRSWSRRRLGQGSFGGLYTIMDGKLPAQASDLALDTGATAPPAPAPIGHLVAHIYIVFIDLDRIPATTVVAIPLRALLQRLDLSLDDGAICWLVALAYIQRVVLGVLFAQADHLLGEKERPFLAAP